MKRHLKILSIAFLAGLGVMALLRLEFGKRASTTRHSNVASSESGTPAISTVSPAVSPPQPSNLDGSSVALPTAQPSVSATHSSRVLPRTPAQQAALESALFGSHGPVTLDSIPPGRFRSELESLDPTARKRALDQLAEMKIPLMDVRSLHVDAEGELLYSCPPPPPPVANHSPSRAQPTSAGSVKIYSSQPQAKQTGDASSASADAATTSFPPVDTIPRMTAAAGVLTNNVPVNTPPPLHSKPGAPNVIYLNFSGQMVTGTAWNLGHAARYPCQPFDLDHDLKTFNPAEQQMIVDIWERVAEHYRPFNVDVTTVKPVSFANNHVATALITRNFDTNGVSLPDAEAGGVAYLSKFGAKDFAKKYSPAFIFFDNLSTNPSYIAEAAAHEIGHNLGLTHDGLVADGWAPAQEYYRGHGSGAISWAPVMGNSYGKSVSQWSQGEYFDANNPQDQVGIIAGKLNFRTDYSSNTMATAIPLATNGITLSGSGVIVKNTDVDYFSFSNSYPQVKMVVSPVRPAEMPWNDPLDVAIDLLDSNGTVISHFAPPLRTDVDVTLPVPLGNYFIRVYDSGTGSPMSNSPTGFTTYGSLGSYTVILTQKPYLPPQIFPGFGDNASLTVTPGGLQPYSFSWSRDGVALPDVTGGTLSLTNVQQSDAGVYAVTVADGLGNTSHCTSWVIPRHDNTTLISTGYNAPVIPASASNVISMSARSSVSAILNADSTVTVLGDNAFGQTNVPTGLTNVIAVSAADAHVLALKSDGTVIGWGDNSRGEIDIPIGLSNVVAIAAGGGVPRSPSYSGITSYSLALKDDGTVVAWGNDDYGQTDVPPGLTNVVAIAAGNSHSLALIEDGSVAAWGGHNTGYDVATVPAGLSNVVSVAADGEVSLALKSDGTVVTWGQHTNVPAGLTNAVAIAQAGNTGTALLNDGTVINWDFFQTNIPPSFYSMVDVQAGTGFLLGLQDLSLMSYASIIAQPVSTTIQNATSATLQVVAGGTAPFSYQWRKNSIPIPGATNPIFVTPSLKYYESGESYDVVISNLFSSLTSTAAVVTVIPPPVVIDPSPQLNFTPGQAVTLTSTVTGIQGPLSYQWYVNNHPISGATNVSLSMPSAQYGDKGFYSLKVTGSESASQSTGTFLVPYFTSTQVVAWGSNTNTPASLTNAVAVEAGIANGAAIKNDGTMIVWGDNSYGQTNVPSDLSNIVAISAGWGFEVALKNDGTVTSIGRGIFTPMTPPAGLSNVISIAAEEDVALALKSDGTVTAWGFNAYGQTNVPSGLTNVISIAAGIANAMAVRNDGSVVTWGASYSTQPSPPAGLTNALMGAVGGYHFLTLNSDATVSAWGMNYNVPETKVPQNLTNVVAVAAGEYFSMALKNDGRFLTWGYNSYGTAPTNLSNVVAIASKKGGSYALVNTSSGTNVPAESPAPTPVPSASPSPSPFPTNSQIITLPPVSSRYYDPTPFWINATSSSGLPVELSVISGPATIAGNKVTLSGVGTVVIAANQSGNWNYLPAPQVTTSFAVTQSFQSISFSPVATLTTTNAPFPLYATTSSGLPVSFSSSAPNVLSISGNTAAVNGWGTAIVTATQGGNSGYAAASPVTQTVTIGVPQSIPPFASIPAVTYAKNKKITITSPRATSGQPVTISVKSGPATISGNTLTLTGRGTVVLAANQTGNSQYLPAPMVTTSFVVK